MAKRKIIIDPFILNKISNSRELTDTEKINLLKYVGYLTNTEKRELAQTL
ncbi:MAG: hypothetical protein QM490_03205 [Candidatus Gracilibacteria bacterium]